MTELRQALGALLDGGSLDAVGAECAFAEILDADPPEALVAGFLVALRMKGESAEELTGATRAMLKRARSLGIDPSGLLDTAGTGGDGARTFNISTGAALVAAAAGVRVAKHGNRAVTGTVGAADVLERIGIRIDLDPEGLKRCLERAGICFIFAPAYHPVLGRLAGLRRKLGTRTIFNLTGPLANPAGARRRLLGVAERRVFRAMAEALGRLDIEHAMVVGGLDGVDEISLSAPTRIAEVSAAGTIREYQVSPEQFGLSRARPTELSATGVDQAARMLRDALAGGSGAAQDVLALNGGAAIYVGGRACSLADGVALAREIIASGDALEVIEKMKQASRQG